MENGNNELDKFELVWLRAKYEMPKRNYAD